MQQYMDYILTQLKALMAIDSPSGYTKEVTDYLMAQYKEMHSIKRWDTHRKRRSKAVF